MQGECHSVLIVSREGKAVDFIRSAMPQSKFHPVLYASSAAEARRTLLRTSVDIMIINMPLSDEFGTSLAISSSKQCAVAALVKPDLLERAVYKLEPYGVITLSKVIQRSVLYQTLMVLAASQMKIRSLREEASTLERRLRELKLVTKAKGLLITKKGMTEEQAHRFIERSAMDSGAKKADAARQIIAELSDEEL